MLLLLAGIATTAENEADELVHRIREKVLDNSRRLPRKVGHD